MDINWTYCNHFAIYTYPKSLYTLNLHIVMYQLCLNKTKEKSEDIHWELRKENENFFPQWRWHGTLIRFGEELH